MSVSDRELNLPKREEKILEFWERNKIFEKTLAKTRRGKPFVFYEGPPYANGLPGIHHFEARVFKDIIIRHRTMRGFFVPRKAGWDTHGLPVEIQVEKELGLKSKKDIERYGIAEFNTKCRMSVMRHKEKWERFTKRIGYWLDLNHAYLTMSTDYIETLWWIIKEIWKKKLLYQDFKVVPWCTRCQTPLSSHELGFGYQTVKDRSVYVKFKLKKGQKIGDFITDDKTFVLSWTTTPWTLPGNVALAVGNAIRYSVLELQTSGERGWGNSGELILRPGKYVLANDRISAVTKEGNYFSKTLTQATGKELVGLAYLPLFNIEELKSKASHRIYPGDFVNTEEGTGVVHTAVMYGEDDYRLGTKVGLPKFHTVTETGHFIKSIGEGLGGLYVKDPKTEEKIVASLKRRELLLTEELYEHDYPFCWRCDTALLYYARQGWWVKMSALKQKLLANNETINWIPDTIKHGRFGEFLREVRDWAFSRERYWGTPLPIWRCRKCENFEVIGSLDELSAMAPKSKNRYLAIRHGQSEIQMLGIADDDKRTYHLTPQGRKEAEQQVKRLSKEKIDLIIASPIQRTRETALILSKILGVRLLTDRRLREIHVGVFEHKPVNHYHRYFSSTLEKFTKRPPQGESLNDLKKRLMALMRDLERKYHGKRILLISHEYPIWILWGASQGFSNKAIVAVKERHGKDFVKTGGRLEIPFRPLPRNAEGDVDLHRPLVDEFELVCTKCRGVMRRVSEVADVWFDSGAMPFAQAHFPFAFAKTLNPKPPPDFAWAKSRRAGETLKLAFPADYICEGVDMTRGWFYTLLAVATALGRKAPYRNVISLGLVLDKNSQKMSKSRGNVVEPNAMIEKYGTDTIRWYFYTVNAPGDPKRFDEKDLLLKLRGPIATLWNSFVFFNTYVEKIRNWKLEIRNSSNVLDQWVLVKFDELTQEVTRLLDRYDIVGAARLLEAFIVDDFSNWYLRRSRRRFQKPENKKEKDEAAAVTAHVLLRLCELMAPFTPFLAEIIYQELKKKLELQEESVHLRGWPKLKVAPPFDKLRVNLARGLIIEMTEVRRLAALALAERAKAGIRVRQPLQALKIRNPKSEIRNRQELLEVLQEEVNVKEVVFDSGIKAEVELDVAITPELREEGLIREFVRNIQEMRREAGFKPGQKVRCQVQGARELESVIKRWQKFIQKEAGVKTLQFGGKKSFTVEREFELDGMKIWVGISKD